MNQIDIQKLSELYKKRDKMLHEIGLLLENFTLIKEIGDQTYDQFFVNVLHPLIKLHVRYPSQEIPNKYFGHKLSLIKYYCETFNEKHVEP